MKSGAAVIAWTRQIYATFYLRIFSQDAGICDSLRETFSVAPELASGLDNLAVIAVTDAHGNTAVFGQTF